MFHLLPDCARAKGSLVDPAGQLSKMKEYLNQSQPNPGPRPPVSPCTLVAECVMNSVVEGKSHCISEDCQIRGGEIIEGGRQHV